MNGEVREFMGLAQDHASRAEYGTDLDDVDGSTVQALLAIAYSNLAIARLKVLEMEEGDEEG